MTRAGFGLSAKVVNRDDVPGNIQLRLIMNMEVRKP